MTAIVLFGPIFVFSVFMTICFGVHYILGGDQ
jgi:hypothetical protein